jgi:predicted nucleotidyltransferase
MTTKEQYIIQLIKSKILEKDPFAEIILFGSHARGEAHKDSDWDILILLNLPNVSRDLEQEFRNELFDVELEVEEPITTFIYPKIQWESKFSITPLYQNIKKEGKRL